MYHYMTSITKAQMQGKTAERDMTNRKPAARGTNTSKPARTRDGKNFPGGRHLRRVLKNLSARQTGFTAKPDRTAPGSMRG